MKNSWSDEFRTKLEDYPSDVPDDVWTAIESRLPFLQEHRRRNIAGLFLLYGGIAASVLLILTIGLYKRYGYSDENHIAVVYPVNRPESPVIACNILEKPENLSFPERFPHPNKDVSMNHAYKEEDIHEETSTPVTRDTKIPDKKTDIGQTSYDDEYYFIGKDKRTEKKIKRLEFGLSASGFTSSSNSGNGYEGSIATQMNSGVLVMGSSHIADLMLLNRYNQVTTESKHFQPLKVGISVNYSISERWKTGTGLTYSMLYSKHRTGSENEYYISRQTLHYIGIPLNIQFNIAKPGNFNIYMTAGGAVEKCVSGTLHTEYHYLNGYLPSETEKLSVRPLQWSVNLSAGLQYDFNNLIGIYAEPGVSYHFKNNSTIETIYSDTPFNFCFSLGIRFSL